MIVHVMMPDMTGLDVLRAVRAEPEARAVPVFMDSAMTDPETARAAFASGAQDFVV